MKLKILSWLICFTALAGADLRAETVLFSSDDVLDITIPLDFKTLCRPKEDESCDFVPTVLEYGDKKQSIPIEIKVRGGWRSLTKNCSAPLLWIRFSDQNSKGTPFEGQDQLPLTTHCGKGLSIESFQAHEDRSDWEQYVLREYLGYRLYNLLTDSSVRARLVRIDYLNPEKPDHLIRNYAFFTEHFDSMAARNDAKRLPRGKFDAARLDKTSADVLALFHFMIGNTDWSIEQERNTALMETSDGRQVPIPYDLDMSGLVNPYYAGPAPGLGLEDVRDRYYLGFCHPDEEWQVLFTQFLELKDAILSMVDEIPGFDRTSTRSTRYFLKKFFRILESDEQCDKVILKTCKPWPLPDSDQVDGSQSP
jgi:hypothetical protein